MQHVFVTLRYEEASSYNTLIKYNICDFTLWMPLPWMTVAVARALHGPGKSKYSCNYRKVL